jgi:hypothetical protein
MAVLPEARTYDFGARAVPLSALAGGAPLSAALGVAPPAFATVASVTDVPSRSFNCPAVTIVSPGATP